MSTAKHAVVFKLQWSSNVVLKSASGIDWIVKRGEEVLMKDYRLFFLKPQGTLNICPTEQLYIVKLCRCKNSCICSTGL